MLLDKYITFHQIVNFFIDTSNLHCIFGNKLDGKVKQMEYEDCFFRDKLVYI